MTDRVRTAAEALVKVWDKGSGTTRINLAARELEAALKPSKKEVADYLDSASLRIRDYFDGEDHIYIAEAINYLREED